MLLIKINAYLKIFARSGQEFFNILQKKYF